MKNDAIRRATPAGEASVVVAILGRMRPLLVILMLSTVTSVAARRGDYGGGSVAAAQAQHAVHGLARRDSIALAPSWRCRHRWRPPTLEQLEGALAVDLVPVQLAARREGGGRSRNEVTAAAPAAAIAAMVGVETTLSAARISDLQSTVCVKMVGKSAAITLPRTGRHDLRRRRR